MFSQIIFRIIFMSIEEFFYYFIQFMNFLPVKIIKKITPKNMKKIFFREKTILEFFEIDQFFSSNKKLNNFKLVNVAFVSYFVISNT